MLLPVILLLIFGIIEVGRAVLIYSEVTNAAREGVRYAVAHPAASAPTVEARARERVFIAPADKTAITVTYDDGVSPVMTPTFGDRVVVTVTHDLTFFTPMIANAIGPLRIGVVSRRTILGGE